MHNPQHYYQLCCQHRGKTVRIYERSGREHIGRIVRVDEQYVWLEKRGGGSLSGFSYGYYGGFYGGGYGYGGLFPVALAAIGGFALGAAFFWW